MNNPEKNNDFNINKLNYNENREINKTKLEITINNTSDFEEIKDKYIQTGKEEYLKALIHFTDLFQEEEKLNIIHNIKNSEFPIDNAKIPPELNNGMIRSIDHKMREVINILINKGDLSQAKNLIEKTIRKESYLGRRKKLEKILKQQGLNYDEI